MLCVPAGKTADGEVTVMAERGNATGIFRREAGTYKWRQTIICFSRNTLIPDAQSPILMPAAIRLPRPISQVKTARLTTELLSASRNANSTNKATQQNRHRQQPVRYWQHAQHNCKSTPQPHRAEPALWPTGTRAIRNKISIIFCFSADLR